MAKTRFSKPLAKPENVSSPRPEVGQVSDLPVRSVERTNYPETEQSGLLRLNPDPPEAPLNRDRKGAA
jgi:hypothetical protein